MPIQATIQGQSGYNYVFIPGSALNSSGQTELASGAYPAAIVNDAVGLQAAYKRLQ